MSIIFIPKVVHNSSVRKWGHADEVFHCVFMQSKNGEGKLEPEFTKPNS